MMCAMTALLVSGFVSQLKAQVKDQVKAQVKDQDYPQRNVRLIIPFSAGGGADVLLRIVANALADHWGQTTIVENRVGGNTVIGTLAAAKSPADGYTLLFAGDQSITTILR